jgi:hypothetical protein
VGRRLAPGTSTGSTSSARRHAEDGPIGDERKNDSSFNAGLNSGSSYEYEDAPNRLHFYILDKTPTHRDLHCNRRAVTGRPGPQTRGVTRVAETLTTPSRDCTFG